MDGVGIRVSTILAEAYRRVLTQKNKIATRTTINSIKGGHRKNRDGVTAYVSADRGLFFIQSGKRANTKLPMKKTGGKWRLVERLELWKNAVGFGGPDFLLARSIARKSRKGIDITGQVLEEERANIMHEIGVEVTDEVENVLVQELKDAFKNF